MLSFLTRYVDKDFGRHSSQLQIAEHDFLHGFGLYVDEHMYGKETRLRVLGLCDQYSSSDLYLPVNIKVLAVNHNRVFRQTNLQSCTDRRISTNNYRLLYKPIILA